MLCSHSQKREDSVKAGGSLGCSDLIEEFSIMKGLKEDKMQEHSSGLQISRFGTLHVSAWKGPIG